MYSRGDKVIYGVSGVMTVEGTETVAVGDVSGSYLVLREYGSASSTLTYVPLDNPELCGLLRPLLSREELLLLIKEAKGSSADEEWESDSRIRAKHFREVIASGDRRAMISMLRLIYLQGKRRAAQGKKNFSGDEAAMKRAEKIIFSEISAVLGIPYGEVGEYIENL